MKWILLLLPLLIGFVFGYWIAPGGASGEADHLNKPGFVNPSTGLPAPDDPSRESGDFVENAGDGDVDVKWLKSINELDPFDQIGVLHGRLRGLAVSEFPALMDEMEGEPYSALSWQIRGMVAARWAQLDPQGMLAYADSKSGAMTWGIYNTVFSAWAKEDVTAAFEAALQLETRRSQQSAVQAVINSVAAESPSRAIQMAKEYYGRELGSQGRWLVQSIFRNWALQDGAAARQNALNMPDGAAKSAALAGSLSEWMAESPLEALDWLDSLPMDSSVYGSRKEVFRQFLNRDFDVARDYIESIDDPVDRREIVENLQFHNLIWQKSYEEIEEVFDWIGTVATGQTYDSRVSNVIGAMVDNDPDRAIDFVLNMRPGNARMNALNSVGSKLAEIDPERAFAFVESLSYEDEKRRALGSMGWRLSQQGVESSSQLVLENPDPLVQQQLAHRISSEWSNFDVEGALVWSESLTDDEARKSAIRSVVSNWIENDPEATLNYVESSIDSGAQVSVLRDAFSNWARNDPQTAAEWLQRLPESVQDENARIYSGVANAYISHDPLAASEWISTLNEGPERDQSVTSLVSNISRTDPEAGFIWAATVSDDNQRSNSLRTSVREWVKSDPEAAFEAVKNAEIPAEEKEPLFKMIEDQG